jgi:hypothetical protein
MLEIRPLSDIHIIEKKKYLMLVLFIIFKLSKHLEAVLSIKCDFNKDKFILSSLVQASIKYLVYSS